MSDRNLVSIQISEQNLAKIKKDIQDIDKTLRPDLISLTPEQRREVPKMGDGTEPFVEKALDYAKSNPEFVPPFVKVDQLATDYKAVKSLNEVYRPLLQILQQLDDSIMLSGSEAYVASLAYYNSVKLAAKMNVPGSKAIFEDLKARFAKSSAPDNSSPSAQ